MAAQRGQHQKPKDYTGKPQRLPLHTLAYSESRDENGERSGDKSKNAKQQRAWMEGIVELYLSTTDDDSVTIGIIERVCRHLGIDIEC